MNRQILAVIVAATCTLVCATDGALALFQQRAEKKKKVSVPERAEKKTLVSLPGADSVLKKPEVGLKLVTSRVGDIQKQLELIQGRNVETLKQLRDGYEKRLRLQKNADDQVEKDNHEIEQEIESIRKENQELRQHADNLSLRSQAQLVSAREMQMNVTSADEFIKSALAFQNESLQAPELRILNELRANESAKQKGQLYGQLYAPRTASLLQVDADIATMPMEAAQALAQSLAASFDEIAQEQNESTAKLEAQFETQLSVLKSRHSALLEQQERLNKTRDDLRAVNHRLVTADRHLANVTANFQEHAAALSGFLEGTWKKDAPKDMELAKTLPKESPKEQPKAVIQAPVMPSALQQKRRVPSSQARSSVHKHGSKRKSKHHKKVH